MLMAPVAQVVTQLLVQPFQMDIIFQVEEVTLAQNGIQTVQAAHQAVAQIVQETTQLADQAVL